MEQLELFKSSRLTPPVSPPDQYYPWTKGWIAKENLEVGQAYYVRAHHFKVAIWTGKAFAGLREKWGCKFIDEEYHYDGLPCGTVKPYALLDMHIEIDER